MNQLTKNAFLLLAFFFLNYGFSQPEQQFANIGDFRTTEGKVIKDCKVGYRTVGKLNADKSNAVLWPTWFTGTSEHAFSFGAVNGLIGRDDLYIIVVDALTNGVSSSPSNAEEFPTISIRDMVNSQHSLLVDHLKIKHLQAVIGISMGGMQAFEWAVAYPDFMEKVIPIIGTPKQSSYDILVWQTMADLITKGEQDKGNLDFAYKRAHNILLMNVNTPTMMATTQPTDSLDVYLNGQYAQLMKPQDYLGGLKAMIPHDIYRSVKTAPEDIKNTIKAEFLIIVATKDHLVNPISSMAFSKLTNSQLVTLESDCGHMSPFCEMEKAKEAISEFLN